MDRSTVAQGRFTGDEHCIERTLDRIGAGQRLPQNGPIIFKPNL